MPHAFPQRLLASAALALVLAFSAAGCSVTGGDVTGSVGGASQPQSEADWRRALDGWAARYREHPDDPETAIHYAQALRATAQRAQAVAVLERATIEHPKDMALLGAYGRALADVGRYEQALDVLGHAHTPDQPDWKILNVQGAVLDQLGRNQEAQRHYATALKIAPNEPSVLSNLGLSYALSGDLKRAEATLRRAAAQPNAGARVRQNLGLVIGLQGRFAEAELIVRADLPPAEAEANVSYLKQMLSQNSQFKKSGRARVPQPEAGT